MFLEIAGDDPWFNNQAYVDTLDKESMKKFIDITYEAYKEAVGDKLVKGTCNLYGRAADVHRRHYMRTLAKERTVLPWTHHLIDGFKKEYGYDILDYLPELIWSLEGGKVSKVKYHYSDYTTGTVCKMFFRPVRQLVRRKQPHADRPHDGRANASVSKLCHRRNHETLQVLPAAWH